MKRLWRIAFGAVVLAASVGLAQAQEKDEEGRRTRPDAIPEVVDTIPDALGGISGIPVLMMRPLAHLEGTLAFLKAEIGITEAQTPQWDAFANALRTAAHELQDQAGPQLGKGMADGGKPSWPDRLARTERVLSARLEAVRSLKGPVSALYAALSDAQKRKADDLMVFPMRMM